jgi:outer membrane lipoprotein carrier protein
MERYTRAALAERFAAIGLMALLLAGGTVACGGETDARVAADEAVGDGRPVEGERGETPPAGVAGPEGGATHATGEDAFGDGSPAGTRSPGPTVPGSSPSATPPATGARPRDGADTQPAPRTDVASTDATLRATARRYEQVRSLQAEFEQELRNPLLGRTTRSRGTLYQRQPDRFLMRFSEPAGDVIVSDGDFFWIYYPSVDDRQVIRTPRGPQGLDLHAQFIGDPVSRFEATSHGRETVQGRPAHVLTLVPRESMGYRSLKVWIDVDDHLVRRFELAEDNGNVRHFELQDVVVNPSLPDRLFEFTPPAGAQVIQR